MKALEENLQIPTVNVEAPYRDFELIKFYKLVKSKNKIIGITIDDESHSISFMLGESKE